MLIFSHIENIFKEHNISAAAYHGGKLNDIDCHELLKLAKPIFSHLETQLHSVTHPDRCIDDEIINAFNEICTILDYLASELRM
jgi:hypothetical protein